MKSAGLAGSEVYEALNKSWKSTCRILLGEEIGDLIHYEAWLKELLPKIEKKKSHISGNDITFARTDYCESARFIALDEMRELSMEPLAINEIKDIDSILEAVSEKWEYTGSKVIGNSKFIESSDNVIDSQYVLDSANIRQSSYVYASLFVNEGTRCSFGNNWLGKSEFCVKSGAYNTRRLFETMWADGSSDIYYSFGTFACNDVLFSFNQRNKRNMIGNLQLPKDKYLELKKKLITEIREELRSNKTFPSIYQLVPNEKPDSDLHISFTQKKDATDMKPIERAFASAFNILFRKEDQLIYDYEPWLSRHFIKSEEVITSFGSKTYRIDKSVGEVDIYPANRVVSYEEGLELAKLQMDEKDVGSIEGIRRGLSRVCYFLGDVSEQSKNAIQCAIAYHVSNVYKTPDANFSEYCGVNHSILTTKYVFGSNRIVDSEFCMKCYNSFNLKRCFELDNCSHCSDSMFLHNCEAISESMFCWNTKSKRYAIGNVQMPPEQYRKIKDALVEQIADEVIRNKGLKLDIYNIGCAKK